MSTAVMAPRPIRSPAPAPAPARPPTQIDVINLSLDDSSDLGNNASLPRRSPSPQPARLETTNARFCLINEAGSPSQTPISPPQKRPGQSSFHSFEPSRPSQPTFRPVQKVTTSNGKSDDAQDMARSSGVRHPNLGHQQAMPSSEHRSPKAIQHVKAISPEYHTPRKPEWDVSRIVQALTTFRQDIKDGHARMTSYIIESTKPVERRVLTGKDLFAGLSSKPTLADEADTMRIKFKVVDPIHFDKSILTSGNRNTPNPRATNVRITMRLDLSRLTKSVFPGIAFTTWKLRRISSPQTRC
jgi:hypothetical protein